jgi:hypothetical protein
MEPPVKKRRGQRIRLQQDAAASPPAVESLLANFLLQKFAWGFMTPQLIQEIASLAIQDFCNAKAVDGCLPNLEKLSKIGSSGKLDNNMHRDLGQFLQNTMVPQGFRAQLPFKNSELQEQTILLPHEVFASLYNNYPKAWQSTLLPKEEVLEAFWTSQADHPNMNGHPIKLRSDYKSKCLPLGLHGDEVPITGKGKIWCKSMLTFQWLSLLGSGWGCSRMIWIWACFDKLLETGQHGTLAVFWKILTWSFFWLQEGKWPTHDWQGNAYTEGTDAANKAGSDLAGGYYATLWSVMGDLDISRKLWNCRTALLTTHAHFADAL